MDGQLNWLDVEHPAGPPLRTMVHRDAASTETDAAESIRPRLNRMHAVVRELFRAHGEMTDETLERLPEVTDWAPSSARKRRSELYQAGELRVIGETTNSRGRRMLVWGLA